MFAITGLVFIAFIAAYLLVSAAVVYHLYHYTLPGWTAARIVVPAFFLLSSLLVASAAYFFFTIPWR